VSRFFLISGVVLSLALIFGALDSDDWLLLILWLAFLAEDFRLFCATPFEFRWTYWWRFLPGGGFATYLLWRRRERELEKGR